MKCPQCQKKHRPGKARNLRCTCRYQFAFDPKKDQGLTDGKFLAILRRVSRNDTVYFTLNQFHAAFCRSQRPTYRMLLGCGVALALAGAVLTVLSPKNLIGLGIVLVLIGSGCLIGALFRAFRAPPSLDAVRALLERWRAAGHTMDTLLTEPRLHTPPPAWQESDIYDYGVERLLLVERDLLVDLFVLNGFHAEERTLILSETGYPNYLMPMARQCLADNPQLPVYLLHDASQRGIRMDRRLRAAALLPLEGHAVHDLGLFPEDIKRLRGLRALQPRRHNFGLSADVLLFATLGAGVGQAMAQNVGFGDLLLQEQSRMRDSNVVADFG